MNMSYKLALVASLAICGLVVGYYALGPGEDVPATDPGARDAAAELEQRPQLGQRRPTRTASEESPDPEAQGTSQRPDALADRTHGRREAPQADDFMAELRRRQAEARSDPASEPAAEPTDAPTDADAHEQAAREADAVPEPVAPDRMAQALQPTDPIPALTIGASRPEAEAETEAETATETETATGADDESDDEARDASEATEPTEPTEAAPQPEPQPEPEPTPSRTDPSVPATYTIASGDTLSALAVRFYDDERHWRAIAQANPTVDPNRLRVGQEIRLPDPAALDRPRGDTAEDTLIYTVRSHDTLGSIARQHYGSPEMWRVIYDANRQTIGEDPNRIREGMRLRIPPAPQGAE